ncbi:MAG: rhodanese-like domain-containing protein [SAR86 cluster bacterium]|jgi:rhodanese-related sulfurtransferase|nr:rhodanese-like domain-containing protein [SAR86 cluster bacterium]|tara:strand:+ start:11191 stop:11562 length:372 start_codon:yes stop_codon:yes gene_type:complete
MKHNQTFLELVQDALSRVSEIDTIQLKSKLDSQEEIYIIDTREDREWDQGRIPNSLHLGKGIIERDIENSIPNRDAQIVLYCQGGFRSALAADNLLKMGYKSPISLSGGFSEWANNGFDIESN